MHGARRSILKMSSPPPEATSLTDQTTPRWPNLLVLAVGVALSIAGLCVLVSLAARKGDAWHVVSFSIYGSTLVILYLIATLYHSARSPRVRAAFRVLDHVSIFLLIAGTYTPFALVNLRGGWGWTIFGLTWGLALLGILFKIFLSVRYHALSTAVYIGMGWIALIALKPAIAVVPATGMLLLFVGGLAYTFGVIFYAWERLPHNEAIWHLFVLGGSICHFFAVLLYV
jgi:hemolysin III